MADARSSSYISIYIFIAALIGAVVGTLFGTIFDGMISGRRTLAVLSAIAAIVADYLVRRYASGAVPNLSLGARSETPSPPLLFVIFVMALAGGLATHDLGLVFNVMAGPVLGGFSGLFATLMAAILVVLQEDERRRVERDSPGAGTKRTTRSPRT